ncbi:MAG TPA: hypothetical protein VGH76_25165 [Actinomycetospora sp.]|uniref:hypothetical protein n=1 Tax=Actinomycetospora sp. TaxID=1872135 RepID=UPI002F41432F
MTPQQQRPVRQAAATIRKALADIQPHPATDDAPAQWEITGVGDHPRTIDAADLNTVLNGYAS